MEEAGTLLSEQGWPSLSCQGREDGSHIPPSTSKHRTVWKAELLQAGLGPDRWCLRGDGQEQPGEELSQLFPAPVACWYYPSRFQKNQKPKPTY